MDFETDKPLSTGFYKLDSILNGGLAPGELLEIYGKSGTGKTQICLKIVTEFVRNRKDGSTVLFIDLKNDLSPSRLFDMCEKDPPSMRRIRIVRESKAEEIINVLEHINEEMAFGQSGFLECLKLIVIDSLPAMIYPEMNRGNNSGRCLQEQISQVIKKCSKQHGVIFVILNNAVSSYERWTNSSESHQIQMKPGLGKYWLTIPHFRIFLQRDNSFKSIIKASLEKSTRTPINTYFDFTITASGIE